MPGGLGPVGFIAFAGVKAAGYVGAAYWLKPRFGLSSDVKPHPFKVGLARTALGIVVGLTYGIAWIWGMDLLRVPEWLFFVFLFPVRMGEWSLILWFFFGREQPQGTKLWVYAFLATLWSYALDAIGILAAIVVPGGIWIC
jgi:hypothetical protein